MLSPSSPPLVGGIFLYKYYINTLGSKMAALSSADFRKNASGGAYAGESRHKIFSLKIKDKKPFILGATKYGKKIIGVDYDQKSGVLLYKETPTTKTIKQVKNTKIFKDPDFGGGAGSGGGAEDTKYTESLQCYYCSYVFNKARKQVKAVTDAQLSSAKQYVFATKSLDECLKNGPPDWIETGVYIKTANALFEKFGNKFKGTVYFHRGSKFMDNVYSAKSATHNLDKKSKNPQAPGSFSNDKWNPGDIWASTFPPNSSPLMESTSSWGELNSEILKLAGVKQSVTKLLGISLKKVGSSATKAKLSEFNADTKTKNYKFKSFKYGKTGDFFNSQDIYVNTSVGEVQFRTFGGETSWQGEIKGGDAAGGKIGGGNVDFYCKQVFKSGIYGDYNNERDLLAGIKKDSQIIPKMYKLYKKYNSKSTPSIKLLTEKEFTAQWSTKDYKFINSKVICMYFLDVLMSGSTAKQDEFITKMFKYAQSDVDQSSYFVKLY